VGGRFRGSCFKARGFWQAETNAGLPLKHDMFPCWFALGPRHSCMETCARLPQSAWCIYDLSLK
jgi:hypothetical protein